MQSKIVELFLEWLESGVLANDSDLLQKVDSSEDLQYINKWKTVKSIGDKDVIAKKYERMGLNLRLMNIAFFMVNNDGLLSAMYNLPMLAVFKDKLEIAANTFISNPADGILSQVWNAPKVIDSVTRTSR